MSHHHHPFAVSFAVLAVLAVLAVGVVGGCTVGPDPERPELPYEIDTPYAATVGEGVAVQPERTLEEVTGWWRRFGDEVTGVLVAAAIDENLDLRASAARVVQAQALVRQARAARLPNLSAGLTASGRQTPETDASDFFPTGGAPGGVTLGGLPDDFIETYDLNLSASWQVDLFGRLRRQEQAARLDYVASRADRVALAHSIVAEVIRGRVAVATLQLRLTLAQDNLESLRETLEVVDNRYGAGVGDPVELRLARENVATAEAQIPPLEAQLATQQYALGVLLGRRPGALKALPETLPPLPELPPPPLGLPAALLDRRPDLLASEFRAKAAQARIGASVAELFPDLSLTGSYGVTSNDLSDLIDSDSIVYSIVGSVAQPIFTGGRIRANIRRAEAVAEELAANYAGTVLTAMREVNEALVREAAGRREVAATITALEEATAAEELARSRFSRGVGNLLSVFEAERRRRNAEERLALARQGVWEARINLHLALGGDWFDATAETDAGVQEQRQ